MTAVSKYIKREGFCDESWTEADLAELWEHAQNLPCNREQVKGDYDRRPKWVCKGDAHPNGKGVSRQFLSDTPRCPVCQSSNVKPVMKRIIGLGSYSISANTRGLRDGVVNPKSKDISQAPVVVRKLAAKLTKLNDGKPINYLSFIAYENEGDHINWHQHNEDRCRDATVYIMSLGEVRTFGIRRVCEKHLICDECNESCHASGKTLCSDCKKKVKARAECFTCETTPKKWTSLHPEHGSVIVLPDEYNRTHEHAVLGTQDVGGDRTKREDKKQGKHSFGLRISINTKNIREEDIAYVERENRGTATIPSEALRKLSADEIHEGIAPGVNRPRVYSIKRKHPRDAVYVGCAGSWKCCKCHEKDVRSGSQHGNSYAPRKWGGHQQNPIAKTPDEYRTKLDALWNSPEPKAVAWKERAIKELRGKNLLCWCLQPDDVDGVKVTKPEGCHARVLFEYVNSKDK
jgi:hypothetical protein